MTNKILNFKLEWELILVPKISKIVMKPTFKYRTSKCWYQLNVTLHEKSDINLPSVFFNDFIMKLRIKSKEWAAETVTRHFSMVWSGGMSKENFFVEPNSIFLSGRYDTNVLKICFCLKFFCLGLLG